VWIFLVVGSLRGGGGDGGEGVGGGGGGVGGGGGEGSPGIVVPGECLCWGGVGWGGRLFEEWGGGGGKRMSTHQKSEPEMEVKKKGQQTSRSKNWMEGFRITFKASTSEERGLGGRKSPGGN